MATQLSIHTAQLPGAAHGKSRNRSSATRLWLEPEAIGGLLEMNVATLRMQGVSV